ncbi:Disintegrin and metalloproteinase domain-containing protein 8 [Anabarilius grahami]|uniref:Disintegrin and metalloproteinase domain-containing protein 8 n=1 Tax=Anabarilius grahami TaxID=495550 RepID=A0A3N0Y5I6_ANAGA|nr:Disintegrin and metalloproteinase domain-containing protein 8 [Anabarilius grahami]
MILNSSILSSVHRGFVRLKKQVYLIEPLTNLTDGDHAVYKHQHLRWKRSSCGEPKTTIYDHKPPVALPLKSSRWKMESFHTPRFVELFLVVDSTEYKNYGSNMDIIRARMLEVANHVDKLYRPLNIRVMLVGLEVWTTQDQFVVSVSSDDTLSRFIKWRKSDLLKRVRHDNAQFVTGIDFLGDTVGLANKYAMCAESSAGVNQDHNKNSLGLASTIAHEMGHNMGMSHDEDHCMCGSDNLYNSICIMTERVGTQFPELFSDCSLEQLSVFLDNANPSCLLDNPSSYRLYSGPVCGNAFLDPGEQCDCGTVEECGNPCCDPTTCRLTEGSQCAHGDCCENCQIKDAENLCRAAVNECDVPEYCTGLSEKCPENDFKMNGIPCSSGKGYCYNGQCPTLLKHCQRLWGTSAKVASEACFLQNTYGKNDSHCGKTKDGYRACTKENRLCGKIFCDGGTEYPITGQKAVIVTLWGMCNIAGDQSEEDALSMVPTGTKCEHNKVCYNYMCQDLNVYGSNENCSLKCSGRGICNHKKQCHCEPGWAPPFCEIKYSELPPEQPKIIGISVAVAIALLVLICGVVLYRKKRKGIISHKTKAPSSGQHLLFENNSTKNDRPQISQPIFMGTTVTQPCTPLTARVGPARPAPPFFGPISTGSIQPFDGSFAGTYQKLGSTLGFLFVSSTLVCRPTGSTLNLQFTGSLQLFDNSFAGTYQKLGSALGFLFASSTLVCRPPGSTSNLPSLHISPSTSWLHLGSFLPWLHLGPSSTGSLLPLTTPSLAPIKLGFTLGFLFASSTLVCRPPDSTSNLQARHSTKAPRPVGSTLAPSSLGSTWDHRP